MRIISRLIVFVVVLAMSIMVVAAPVSAAPNAQFPNPLGTHTVKQGEWIYCIARAYKVSPWSIASVNHIPWPYWVYPNQVLTIPADPWYNIPAGQTCVPQFDPGGPNLCGAVPDTGWLAATAADSGTHYSSADAWSIPHTSAGVLSLLSLRAVGTDIVRHRLVLWHHHSGHHVGQSRHHKPESDLRRLDVVYSLKSVVTRGGRSASAASTGIC
jgi:LysM repeat protein